MVFTIVDAAKNETIYKEDQPDFFLSESDIKKEIYDGEDIEMDPLNLEIDVKEEKILDENEILNKKAIQIIKPIKIEKDKSPPIFVNKTYSKNVTEETKNYYSRWTIEETKFFIWSRIENHHLFFQEKFAANKAWE